MGLLWTHCRAGCGLDRHDNGAMVVVAGSEARVENVALLVGLASVGAS